MQNLYHLTLQEHNQYMKQMVLAQNNSLCFNRNGYLKEVTPLPYAYANQVPNICHPHAGCNHHQGKFDGALLPIVQCHLKIAKTQKNSEIQYTFSDSHQPIRGLMGCTFSSVKLILVCLYYFFYTQFLTTDLHHCCMERFMIMM